MKITFTNFDEINTIILLNKWSQKTLPFVEGEHINTAYFDLEIRL